MIEDLSQMKVLYNRKSEQLTCTGNHSAMNIHIKKDMSGLSGHIPKKESELDCYRRENSLP